jgi:hypothetical protein
MTVEIWIINKEVIVLASTSYIDPNFRICVYQYTQTRRKRQFYVIDATRNASCEKKVLY